MSAKKDNSKAAKSMTEHYTLGHKAVAVAMSTVMLGFGVPAASPADSYADTDAANEQPADGAAATTAGTSEEASTGTAETAKNSGSSSASSKSESSSASAAAKEKEEAAKATASVSLSLGNASIKYQGQTIAAPTSKVTVPTKNDFKFTVSADNGYDLTKVVLKVSGKESTLTANGAGTYTVAAADVAAGASIKLVTQQQAQSAPAATVTPIQDTQATQEAQQPAASDQAQQSGTEESANQGAQEGNADESGADEGQGNEDEAADANASSNQGTEEATEESNEEQLNELENQFISLFAAASGNATATYDMVVGKSQQISVSGYSDWTYSHTWTSTDSSVANVEGGWGGYATITAGKAGTAVITDVVTRQKGWSGQVETVATFTYVVNVSEPSVQIVSGPKEILLGDSGTFVCEANVPIVSWHVDGAGKGAFEPNYVQTSGTEQTFTAKRGWNFDGDSTTVDITVRYGDNSYSEPYTVTLMKRSFVVSEPPVFDDDSAEHYWVPELKDAVTGEVINDVSNANYEIKYYKNGKYIGNQNDVQTKSYWAHVAGNDDESLYGPGKYTVEVISNSGWEYKTGTTTIDVPTEYRSFNTNDPVDYMYDGQEHKWAPEVTDQETGEVLTEGTDYELSYDKTDFTNPGTITVTITGKGNYKGSTATKTYRIIKVSILGKDTIKEGDKTTYTPEGFTSDVTWSSSNSNILSIDPVTGEATGLYPGTVTIYAVDKEGHMASKDVTVTRDESNGAWVYVYTKVVYNGVSLSDSAEGRAKAKELGLTVNSHSWFTLGKVWVSGIKPASDKYNTDSYKSEYKDKSVKALGNIERFDKNGNINLDDVTWEKLLTYSNQGADNYVAAGNTWHLDGQVDIKTMTKVNIHYVEKGNTSNELAPTEQLTVQTGKSFDPASQKIDIPGYTFDSADAAFEPQEKETKDVYLYYTKGTFPYTVNYVDKETGEKLRDSVTHGGEFGADVTENAVDIAGYNPDAAQKTLKIGTDGNSITFYYTKKSVDYTINYLLNGTDTEVADSDTGTGKYGDTISATLKSIDGYTIVPGQEATSSINLSDGSNVINVYYYKNVELTANSDTKEYNGEEQSVSGFTGAPEDAQFNIAVGAKGTDAGTYPATFPEGTEGAVDGSGKYIVTKATDGKLEITKSKQQVTVTITGHTASPMYNGQLQTVEGYDITDLPTGLSTDDIKLKEGETASVSATDAGTYQMGLSADKFSYVGKNYENVSFKVEDGELNIAKREITLSTADGEKTYDGTPLTKNTDADFTISGDGLVGSDTITHTITGTQTDAGESKNTFTYAFGNSDAAKNYQVTEQPGKLKVNAITAPVTVTIAENSGTKKYDGTEQSVTGYTVKSISNSLYKESDFQFTGTDADKTAKGTDADTYDMGVTASMFKNISKNFSNVTFQVEDGKLVIEKRQVTLTSATDSKVYDGSPLTNSEVKESGDGFVKGQGASYDVTGSQTVVGSSYNEFSYSLNNGTNADNYDITKNVGTLTVTSREAKYGITVEAKSDEATYNGQNQSVSGLVSNTFTVDGNTYTVSGLQASSTPAKNAGTYTSTVTGTPKVTDAKGNDVTSEFKVEMKNGTFKINPRPVELTSATAEKVYDGNELTNHNVTDEGFVDGEGATYTVTGSQTDAGESKNTFSYALNEGTLSSNYAITKTEGTLKVTPVTEKVTVTINGNNGSYTYDGSEKSASGYAASSDNKLYNSNCFSFSGTSEVKGTNAGRYVMGLKADQFANTSKNFTNVEFVVKEDGVLSIAKRPVTITSVGKQFTYNGQAQSYPNAKCDEDDPVFNKETEALTSSGSVTNVGDTAKNKIQFTWKNGFSEDNYSITRNEGDLSVAPIADEVVAEITGHTASPMYNGTEQHVDGYDVSISGSDLYKSDYVSFNGQAHASGIDVKGGGYTMGLDATQFTNNSKNFSNVKFEVTDGGLTITKRDVSLKSEGNTWNYTGETFTLPEVEATGAGFVAGEVSDIKATGSVTNVGDEKKNTIVWTPGANFKEGNYDIKKDEGTLKVVKGNAISDYVTLAPTNVTATYDGENHMAGTATATDKNNKSLTIEYSTDGKTWTTDPANITAKNAGTTTVKVRVSSANYEGYVEGSETITINTRAVTLKSETASKPYDGTALTRPNVSGAEFNEEAGTGFVSGEVTDVKATGSVTNVAEGEVVNAIEYKTGEGFDERNYTINKEEGKLSITPGTGLEKVVKLVTASFGHVYTGTPHALPASTATASDNSPLVIEYSVDGTNWTTEPSSITAVNVADSKKVQVRVSSTNFSDVVTGEATLTVVPRTVTLTSQSAKKTYDGTALEQPTITVGANGFVAGEVSNLRATGSITNVGSETNAISYDTVEGKFIPENYSITKTEGTLEVTGQSIVPDPQNPDSYLGIQIDSPSDSVYDGKEHKWVPSVKDKSGNALKEGTDYTVSYDKSDFTNVTGDIKVTITGTGNYTGTVTKSYKITPKALSVTTPSASKVFDGTALTAQGTQSNIAGLVEGETAAVKATGSQTEVGSSANTYSGIAWGSGTKESNYTISSIGEGMLTVSAKPVANLTVGALEDVTYNGTSQAKKPEVKDGEKTLMEGTDYDLSFSEDTTNVGTVTVTVTGKGNYAGSVDRTYKINPAKLVVTTPSQSKVYDGSALTAEGKITGFVNNETADFKTTGSQTQVGSCQNGYAINWTGTAKQGNYTIEEHLGMLTVTESAQEIVATAVGGTYTYDGQPHGATVQVSNLPKGYTVKTALSNATATDVTEGDGVTANVDSLVIVNAEGEDVTSKLNITTKPGTIKVNPATLTVTTPSTSKAYDGTALTAEGKISGFVNGEEATFTTTGSQTTVGSSSNTYEIVWNGNAKQSNYKVEESLGTLEVTKSQVAIMVVPQGATKVYDGTPLASAGATTYGLPSGFTLEATVNGTQTDAGNKVVGVDSYVIKNAAGEDVTSQFGNVSTGFANLTVTKRPVTLTAQGGTWTYDGSEHKNESVVASTGENEGFVEGQGFDYGNFARITAVGTVANTFEYKAQRGTNADNYEVKVVNQNLVVTAKSIEDEEHGMNVDSPADVTYDANEHKWAPTVKDGNKTLVEGTDYTVSYDKDDFTNVKGIITVTVKGMGNYSGTVTRTYQITQAEVKLESNTHEFDYNGTYQSDDSVAVYGADALFLSQVDGLKATGKVKDVSEGKVPNNITYTWKEGFSADNYRIETVLGTLSIKAKDISTAADMAVDEPVNVEYDGATHQWKPTVKDGSKVLTEGTDYTVSYSTDNFTDVTGTITVTITGTGNYTGTVKRTYQITPKQLTVTTPSASKVFDGTALTAQGTQDNITGLVGNETATVKAKGTQTEVGSSSNDFDSIEWGTAKAGNYTVSVSQLGTLTVTAQSIVPDPQNPDSYLGIQIDSPSDSVYDGKEHKWVPAVKDKSGNALKEGTDYTVSYSTDNFTDVTGDITVTITGAGNYTGTATRTYKITPASYYVVTDSAEKTYDGTALTASGKVAGLVGSEEVSFSTTGSQTNAGSSQNGYSLKFDKSAKEGNYTHGTDQIGILKVNKAKAEGNITLSGTDAEKTYDGAALTANKATASDAHGNAMKVEYSLDGANWTEDASSITATDAADSATVQLRASSEANYEGYVYATEKLTVNKRSVKLTGASDSKVYDGTALQNRNVTIEGDGFVDGEATDIVATGTITEKGSVENPVSFKAAGSFKEGNYRIETVSGTLTVTAQSIVPDPQSPDSYKNITISDPSDSVYDGKEHKWEPVVKAADGTALVKGTDYTVSYDTDDFTDVRVIKATIVGIGNYTGSVTKSYQITPAKVYIETESAEKVYDGTDLTAPGSIKGIVEGETVGFTVTGKQSSVGSSENTYKLEWNGSAKASNYTIESVKVGMLTVKESEEQVVVTTTGGTYTYDGQAHGATVQVGTLPAGYSVRTAESSATATNVAEGEVPATADNLVIVNAEGEDVTSKLNIVKVDGSIQIVPAALTVSTGSASKVYDGTALTNRDLQIAGLVNGEQVVARTTGSQTEVGSSANTYEIAWGNVDPANYEVTESLGMLEVTPVPAVTPDNGGTTPGGNGTTVPGGNPVLNNVARILANGYTAATGEATVAAPEEQIFDEENPLGTTYEEVCWVHFYIILGMILSGIYGLGVMFRRLNHIRRLRNDMNDVMGNGSGSDKEEAPLSTTNPAGMEA